MKEISISRAPESVKNWGKTWHVRRLPMMIRCTFSVPFEKIRDYAKEFSELSSLPEYITKRGPYIKETPGGGSKIIISYDFDKARLAEAWEVISKQFDIFHGLPGFSLSAHILEKSKEVKRYPLDQKVQRLESYAGK
jgi:hypothetical protein